MKYLCCNIILFTLALISGAGHSAEKQDMIKPTSAELFDLAHLSREALSATINKRPLNNEKSLNQSLSNNNNGIFIYLIQNGQVIASGNGFGSNITTNTRLAAGNAVYNKNITRLKDIPVFTVVCGKEAKVQTPVFHKMKKGQEAYLLQYKNKKIYLSPFEPLLNGWDWKETVLTLAKKVCETSNPTTSDLIRTAASSEFRLTVMPADIVATASANDQPTLLSAFNKPEELVNPQSLKDALLESAQWYINNQDNKTGAFAGEINLITGRAGPAAADVSAFLNIIALSGIHEITGDKNVLFIARRSLDNLLINHFFENPKADQGYIKKENSVNLLDSSSALWAISSISADVSNTEIAKIANSLNSFILAMRKTDGEFIPWFYPSGKNEKSGEYAPVSIIALLNWKAHKHSAEIIKSAEYYRRFYTVAAGSHPPVNIIGWYTAAATMVYSHTHQRAYADWVLEINNVLARHWLEHNAVSRNKNATAYDSALVLYSLCNALSLQKLLYPTTNNSDSLRIALLRKAIISSAQYLLHLQVKSGPEVFLMSDYKKGVGAFRTSPDELNTDLISNAMATMAIYKAVKVLDNTDL